MGEEESSLRDDLEAAFADHDETGDAEGSTNLAGDSSDETTTSTEAAGTGSDGLSEDESSTGELEKNPLPEDSGDVAAAPFGLEESAGSEKEGAASDIEDKRSTKAPVGWSPKQREDWSKIPRHLQDKIISREQDMASTMEGTAQARQTHDKMAQLGQNYASVLAAEGVNDPMQAVESLFQTTASLRMGTTEQKAQTIAGLISHYGIDIQALDNVLSGEVTQSTGENAQLEQMINQRMAPIDSLMQRISQQETQQQEQQKTEATNSVKDFAQTAEFLPDVRNDMADLIDMASARGQTMTLQDAYNKACTLNPQIQEVLSQRQQQQRLTGNSSNMARKRSAASSLNGRMSGGVNAPDPSTMTLRESISAAWDAAGEE